MSIETPPPELLYPVVFNLWLTGMEAHFFYICAKEAYDEIGEDIKNGVGSKIMAELRQNELANLLRKLGGTPA